MQEKKWFVYMEDHHEGPFSLTDVQQKIGENSVRKDQYVWAEGMQDWKPMAEVSDFQFLFIPKSNGLPSASSLQVSNEVAIESVDREGLPALEVPIQTMMEQSLTSIPALKTEATGSAGAPHTMSAGPNLGELSEAVSAPMSAPDPTPIQESAPLPSREQTQERSSVSKRTVAPSKTRDTESLTASNPAVPALETRERVAMIQEGVMVKGGPNKFKKFIKTFVFLALVGGGAWAYLQGYADPVLKNPAIKEGFQKVVDLAQPGIAMLVEKVPMLGEFLSPLPKLTDVSPQDYEELRGAATTSLTSVGPAVGIAPVTGGQGTAFYVSSNLPDGASLTIHLEGVTGTLLNAVDFTSKVNVTVTQKLGKSKTFAQPDGSAIPKGDYNVYVYEADQQSEAVKMILSSAKSNAEGKLPRVLAPGKKVATAKKYFLGGVKDKTYEDRLKEYQDRVRVRAKQDFEELSQSVATLAQQLNSAYKLYQETLAQVTKAKGKPGSTSAFKSVAKSWNSKASKWLVFQNQINKFEKWTPEYMQASFYPNVYARVRKISEALLGYYQAQSGFLNNPADAALEAKVGDAQKEVTGLFGELSPKMKQISEAVNSPTGFPGKVD